MRRTRRKSIAATATTAVAAPVITESPNKNSESDSSDSSEQRQIPKKRVSRLASQRFRMKKDDNEEFVKICVDNFESINSTATLKGSFAHKKTAEVSKIWEKIAMQCNSLFNVSKFDFVFDKFKTILFISGKKNQAISLVSFNRFIFKVKIIHKLFRFILLAFFFVS